MSYGSPNGVISGSLLMDPISPPYHEQLPNPQAAVVGPSQPQYPQVAYTYKGKGFTSIGIVKVLKKRISSRMNKTLLLPFSHT